MTGATMDESVSFHSKFGGLWYDSRDEAAIVARLAAVADRQTRERLASFSRSGYVILENAVSHFAIDKYLAAFDAVAAEPGRLLMNVPFGPMYQPYDKADLLLPGAKVLDSAMILPEGEELSFSLPLSMFLQHLFDGPALAFQSLHFEVASTQPVHQDTAYVVVDKHPLHMVASWIALEDVQIGAGELVYFPGSHHLPEFTYDNSASKHFDFARDGGEANVAHLQYLTDKIGHEEPHHFMAKKGDVLIWHADLPYGDNLVTKPGVTRRSLVTHYCPAGLTPHYFKFLAPENQNKLKTASGNFSCSMYYPNQA